MRPPECVCCRSTIRSMVSSRHVASTHASDRRSPRILQTASQQCDRLPQIDDSCTPGEKPVSCCERQEPHHGTTCERQELSCELAILIHRPSDAIRTGIHRMLTATIRVVPAKMTGIPSFHRPYDYFSYIPVIHPHTTFITLRATRLRLPWTTSRTGVVCGADTRRDP